MPFCRQNNWAKIRLKLMEMCVRGVCWLLLWAVCAGGCVSAALIYVSALLVSYLPMPLVCLIPLAIIA